MKEKDATEKNIVFTFYGDEENEVGIIEIHMLVLHGSMR